MNFHSVTRKLVIVQCTFQTSYVCSLDTVTLTTIQLFNFPRVRLCTIASWTLTFRCCHPSNLLSPPYRDQKQANDLKTILGDSSALINWTGPVCKIIHFPTCVHATKGWLASPGNQQTPIHSAVSWKRAGSKITCGCSRRWSSACGDYRIIYFVLKLLSLVC